MSVRGIPHIAGTAAAESLVLDEPLSLWGGVDPASGTIIDGHHPQAGESIAGTVLLIPDGRGSSSGSAVLTECIRSGTAPAAIVMAELDPILVVGVLAARELYPERSCPLIELDTGFTELASHTHTVIYADGRIDQR